MKKLQPGCSRLSWIWCWPTTLSNLKFVLQLMLSTFLYVKRVNDTKFKTNLVVQAVVWFVAKPSLKIGTAKRHLLELLGLFRDYSLDHVFFRNKTFLFFKMQSWNSQHLFEREFREASQNFKEKNGNKNCLNELNELKFCEVSQILF